MIQVVILALIIPLIGTSLGSAIGFIIMILDVALG